MEIYVVEGKVKESYTRWSPVLLYNNRIQGASCVKERASNAAKQMSELNPHVEYRVVPYTREPGWPDHGDDITEGKVPKLDGSCCCRS